MEIGFALLRNGKVTKLEKGINLDVRDIAKKLRSSSYDWAVFHTRLASIGAKSNNNCHPFRRGNMVMAMNGTEHSVSFISETIEITDTEAILDLMNKYHLNLTALKRFRSIFMGFYNGQPFVVAGNTSSIKMLVNKESKALVFASDFPGKFKHNIYETSKCFSWNGGKLPTTLLKYKKRYYYPNRHVHFNDYDYYNDLYGQCYLELLEKGG